MTMTKALLDVSKELKKLVMKTEKLAEALEEADKLKARPVKAKTVKKAPAKKAAAVPAKAKVVKKVPAGKSATKNVALQPTATDQVLKIINRSKKGVGVAALMKKTGFNQKKIYNIVQRTSKQGKIKNAGKGIYVGA